MATIRSLRELERKQIRDREEVVSRLGRRLVSIYAQAIQRLGNDSESADDFREAFSRTQELDRILQELGLGDELRRIQAHYRRELQNAAALFAEGTGQPISGLSIDALTALVDLDMEQITKSLDSYGVDIRSEIVRSVTLGSTEGLTDFIDTMSERIGRVAATEINTSYASFSRAATAEFAEQVGLDLFLYDGPDDALTRDFCNEVLDRDPPIYTLEEIQALDNGSGLDVLTSGGGFNCRHQWVPISEEFARNLGYDGRD